MNDDLDLLTRALQSDAACPDARLPSADAIWLRAHLEARRQKVERASRPVAMFEWIAVPTAAMALLAVLTRL